MQKLGRNIFWKSTGWTRRTGIIFRLQNPGRNPYSWKMFLFLFHHKNFYPCFIFLCKLRYFFSNTGQTFSFVDTCESKYCFTRLETWSLVETLVRQFCLTSRISTRVTSLCHLGQFDLRELPLDRTFNLNIEGLARGKRQKKVSLNKALKISLTTWCNYFHHYILLRTDGYTTRLTRLRTIFSLTKCQPSKH